MVVPAGPAQLLGMPDVRARQQAAFQAATRDGGAGAMSFWGPELPAGARMRKLVIAGRVLLVLATIACAVGWVKLLAIVLSLP